MEYEGVEGDIWFIETRRLAGPGADVDGDADEGSSTR